MFTTTPILRALGAVRESAAIFMRLLISAVTSALRWSRDNIPRTLGLRVMPDLLPESARAHEFKLPMRGYSQFDSYSCGVAAGWSVLRYFNPGADFKKFDEACAPHPEWGTPTRRLSAALRKNGLRVYRRADLDFDAIKAFLASGFPILTTIRERHWEDNVHHWAVIYGFGSKPRRMHIVGRTGAPGFAKMEMPWRKFKGIWSGKGRRVRLRSCTSLPSRPIPRTSNPSPEAHQPISSSEQASTELVGRFNHDGTECRAGLLRFGTEPNAVGGKF